MRQEHVSSNHFVGKIAAVIVAAFASMLILCFSASNAFAATQYYSYFDDGDKYISVENFGLDSDDVYVTKASSTDSTVVKVSYSDGKFTGKMVGLGTATVTFQYRHVDEGGNATGPVYAQTMTFSPEKSWTCYACDSIYTGTKLTFKQLTGYDKPANGGKFLKGKGYKVYSKGSKIKFTKSGKRTVSYKVDGKTYKFTFKSVHSYKSAKKALAKKIKAAAKYPKTYKYKSAKLVTHTVTNETVLNKMAENGDSSKVRAVQITYNIKGADKKYHKKLHAWGFYYHGTFYCDLPN